MKKLLVICLVVYIVMMSVALCEEETTWDETPVIIKAYEQSHEQLYLEWSGNARLYQIYMDGKKITSVIVNNAVIPIKKGTHSIIVYPIFEGSYSDSSFSVGLNIGDFGGGSLNIDLASLGLDAKKLVAGRPSDALNIDYIPDTIFNTTPEKLAFDVDTQDRVHISFFDPYISDEYAVAIMSGKNVSYVRFNTHSDEVHSFILRDNSHVTLILDQSILKQQSCIVPELDKKYSFTVQFRKNAVDLLTREKTSLVFHESKESKKTNYTPVAAWKEAPIITYASQTADGQITLQWTHENSIPGCEYSIKKIDKMLGINTKENELTRTEDKEIIMNDFVNGSYSFKIIPEYNGEKGTASDEVAVEIKNNWVIAPILTCEQIELGKVKLSWKSAEGIDRYHITVYLGDQTSLLSYVNLDYKKYTEVDVSVEQEDMEYVFSYDENQPENGLKLKFEMIGIRYTEDGNEQKTAKTIQTINTK